MPRFFHRRFVHFLSVPLLLRGRNGTLTPVTPRLFPPTFYFSFTRIENEFRKSKVR
jgi:hypothetical protein